MHNQEMTCINAGIKTGINENVEERVDTHEVLAYRGYGATQTRQR
jgi:predicted GIY-YIG superfamily endonuclease